MLDPIKNTKEEAQKNLLSIAIPLAMEDVKLLKEDGENLTLKELKNITQRMSKAVKLVKKH